MRLLDTDICIAYLNGTDPQVKKRLLELAPDDVCLCSVVKAELLFGARNSMRVAENLQRVFAFFELLSSLPLDDAAAEHYGVIRTQLTREGTPIGANDMFIAAIALTHDCTLVTRNTREFSRVMGLRVEAW